MTMRIGTTASATEIAARNSVCNALVDLLDVGGAGSLELCSGTAPTNVGDAGTVLATFTLPATAFGSAAAGVATASAISSVVASGTGVVGYAVARDNAGKGVWDNDDVGTSGTQLVLNTTTINTGADVSVTSWTVTMPAS